MAYYHLTEAYADLHNPRKIEENKMFYDNLRFVDYLSQEDIQEVMESIIWECMDYGNSLQESYDMISEVFSNNILEEVLFETKECYLDESIGSAISSLGQKIERGEQRAGRFVTRQRQRASDAASATREFGSAQKQRLQARQAQIQGGLSAAGKAIANAPGAAYRATAGAAGRAYKAASGQVGKAQAALGSLARRGLSKLSRTGITLGDVIRRSGEAAHLKKEYSATGGTTPTRVYRTTPLGRSKRERLGTAISQMALGISPTLALPPGSATTAHTGRGGLGARRTPQQIAKNLKTQSTRGSQRMRVTEDMVSHLLNTLVDRGYADNYDNAAIILENFSDKAIFSLIEEFAY